MFGLEFNDDLDSDYMCEQTVRRTIRRNEEATPLLDIEKVVRIDENRNSQFLWRKCSGKLRSILQGARALYFKEIIFNIAN